MGAINGAGGRKFSVVYFRHRRPTAGILATMAILFYVNGFHEQTFEDHEYLGALKQMDLVEYQDTSRSLLLTDGPDWVQLINFRPQKTFSEKIWG